MNTDNARKVPADAPTDFIKPRWHKLVMTDGGIDRRYYELCALSELKNSLLTTILADAINLGLTKMAEFETRHDLRQARRGQVQAAPTVATGLACFIFRFPRRPHICRQTVPGKLDLTVATLAI